MPSLSEIARDERTARMVLSMLVEPDDAVTGRLLATFGAASKPCGLLSQTAPFLASATLTPESGADASPLRVSIYSTSASSRHNEPGSAS